MGTFAIGKGSFIFAGLLGFVAEDLSVSVGTAGQLITAFAIVYALLSPVLVTTLNDVPSHRLHFAFPTSRSCSSPPARRQSYPRC